MLSALRLCVSTILISCLLGTAARAAEASFAPGAIITMQNWETYRQFMPDGMAALFAGSYFWKIPADVQLEVGPTALHPLPKGYLVATVKYGRQTRLVHLANGGYNVAEYIAGEPFPNPSDPDKGWKILADVWYRYIPHLIVGTPDNMGVSCSQDRLGSISCSRSILVERQLMHNTDPGLPVSDPHLTGEEYTEWNMVEEPEELRYSASLTIFPADLARPQEVYLFRPDLRRTLRVSSSSRCHPLSGSDYTEDDVRFGFNGNITQFTAAFLRAQKILAMINRNTEGGVFPTNYDMPLGWPKPSWGKWELRDAYVIDVRRAPAFNAGYCYGKRIMYVDQQSMAPLWEDLYDQSLKLWKVYLLTLRARELPDLGIVDSSGSSLNMIWDVQHEHASYFRSEDGRGHEWLVNQQVPPLYDDVVRYSTPGGLSAIMR